MLHETSDVVDYSGNRAAGKPSSGSENVQLNICLNYAIDTSCKKKSTLSLILTLVVLLSATPAHAYIGPGAGFAFLGSTFVFLLTGMMLVATLLLWPFRWIIRAVRRRGLGRTAKSKRVIIVGLDGLEPTLTEKFMQEGLLPNLERLSQSGSYKRLGTTLPAISPVAWSTFQTGVNPGAHNIFDFLTRDKRHCLPLLSSTRTETQAKVLKLGPFKIPYGGPRIELLRRSQPFWKILGKYGIFSNVLRVPISYPPEPFYGNILSAMCTPDLKGSQGSFSFFSSAQDGVRLSNDGTSGGERRPLRKEGELHHGSICGPTINGKELTASFSLTICGENRATLRIGKLRQELTLNEYSPWLEVVFSLGRKKIRGIARFCLRQVSPALELYVTPVNIDPRSPALPIGHPVLFPRWLAARLGPYGTLGLMEDTWGRNEGAIDDQRFLDQTYSVHEERERMFFDVLDRTREGVCACVFDASDRIQHMFWRYLDLNHPAPRESPAFAGTIAEMYQRMDKLVGKVVAQLREGDTLFVMSDHGFTSFRRGINLNSWLLQQGYITLKSGCGLEGDYLQNVDWNKTKAFGIGLTGIFFNRRGRETFGILDDKEVEALKKEMIAKLEGLPDPKDGTQAIRKVYDSGKEYRGIYTLEAPDLIVGYAPGYRVSWDSVTGGFEQEVFSDNIKAWSGDHNVDPDAVPGILFSNKKLQVSAPHIRDLAPTVLSLFAVPVPGYMEGQTIL